MTPREFAIDVVFKLQHAGYTAFWAGGCVRDELLGAMPDDYDVATSASPEQVQSLFRRTIAIGASFGVIDVLGPKVQGEWLNVQVATFRSDGLYIDGRRPESVTFSTPEQDAQRRDFTINGMFFDPVADVLHDYVGGRNDLTNRILRAIGDPAARFEEDKLRLLRAVRMATRFDLAIDPLLLSAARKLAPQIAVVSPERIAEELRKLLTHPRRAFGFQLLYDFGLLTSVLPEVVAEFERALRTVALLPPVSSFPLALASVLSHTTLSEAKSVGRRLRLSNEEIARVTWLLTMRPSLDEPAQLPKHVLYPILAHPGVRELLTLLHAMARADERQESWIEFCHEVLQSTPVEVLNPPPLITGDDLVAAGWQPGPAFKQVLDCIRAGQLDGDILDRKVALELATGKLSLKDQSRGRN